MLVLYEYAIEIFEYSNLKKSYISVIVPTVDLGFLFTVFCSIAITGLNPSILSTSGLFKLPINCLAYDENVSIYLLWAST